MSGAMIVTPAHTIRTAYDTNIQPRRCWWPRCRRGSRAADVAVAQWRRPGRGLHRQRRIIGDPAGARSCHTALDRFVTLAPPPRRLWRTSTAMSALDTVAVEQYGGPFQQRVWAALRALPPGRPASYRELALRLGGPGHARAVGMGCATNSVSPIVPCHRVTGAMVPATSGTWNGSGGCSTTNADTAEAFETAPEQPGVWLSPHWYHTGGSIAAVFASVGTLHDRVVGPDSPCFRLEIGCSLIRRVVIGAPP